MTTQQTNAIKTVLEGLAAERFTADQAARDAAELDAVSVYYAVQVKLARYCGRVANKQPEE
jgi:hypothetical protein